MKSGPYHFGLIGYPLGHSRSPQLHHAALNHYGLEGEYTLFPVPPLPEGEPQIIDLLVRLRNRELHGLNVTIPHKPSVMPHVDTLTMVAKAVGAVNTLYLDEQGRLVGDNTDVPGFWADLRRLIGGQRGLALVLGAGGSARAVAYALARIGWQVVILARHVEQALHIVRDLCTAPELSNANLQADNLSAQAIDEFLPICRLVVNTTPVGMHPNTECSPWPDGIHLPPGAAVYDLVYNPPETVLTRTARQVGLKACTGGGMLSAQAALAFARWTGLEPPFEIMEKVIRNS